MYIIVYTDFKQRLGSGFLHKHLSDSGWLARFLTGTWKQQNTNVLLFWKHYIQSWNMNRIKAITLNMKMIRNEPIEAGRCLQEDRGEGRATIQTRDVHFLKKICVVASGPAGLICSQGEEPYLNTASRVVPHVNFMERLSVHWTGRNCLGLFTTTNS